MARGGPAHRQGGVRIGQSCKGLLACSIGPGSRRTHLPGPRPARQRRRTVRFGGVGRHRGVVRLGGKPRSREPGSAVRRGRAIVCCTPRLLALVVCYLSPASGREPADRWRFVCPTKGEAPDPGGSGSAASRGRSSVSSASPGRVVPGGWWVRVLARCSCGRASGCPSAGKHHAGRPKCRRWSHVPWTRRRWARWQRDVIPSPGAEGKLRRPGHEVCWARSTSL